MRPQAEEMHQLYTQVCSVLADPRRLVILNALRRGRLSLARLSALLELSPAEVLEHLAVLERRFLVVVERPGAEVYGRLSQPAIIRALDVMRDVLAEKTARRTPPPWAHRETSGPNGGQDAFTPRREGR
jgi:DNA-binding transcriptional ArsR family regulator